MRRALLLAVVPVAVWQCAKADSVTELMVVVDTDLATPADLEDVQIAVDGPNGFHDERRANVAAGAPPFPVTLGVEASSTGERATITVTGRRAGKPVVTRLAVAGFVASETRMLRASLCRDCEDVTCPAGQTCILGACLDATLDANALPPWPGSPPSGNGCQGIPPGVDAGPDGGSLADGGTDASEAGAPCEHPPIDLTDGGDLDFSTCGPTLSVCSPPKIVQCGIFATRALKSGNYTVTTNDPNIALVDLDAECGLGPDRSTCGSGTVIGHVTAGGVGGVCVTLGPCKTIHITVTPP